MLCSARRFLLRNLFPHICITLFHLSIFVSVCAFSPPLWRMINISVKCHFSSRPVYSPCLHQGFELSCPPGASALAEASAYMHSHGHTCADTHTHTHTHSIIRPKLILPCQQTQLCQQTALCNSPNYPAAPCLVQLPQRTLLIYNVTSSGVSTLHRPHAYKFDSAGKHAFLHMCVCLSCWWLPSSEAASQLGWFSPSSQQPAATYTSWAVAVNKEIQSTASSHIASPPLRFPPGCCKGKRSRITFTNQYVYMGWLSGRLVDQMMVAFGEKAS